MNNIRFELIENNKDVKYWIILFLTILSILGFIYFNFIIEIKIYDKVSFFIFLFFLFYSTFILKDKVTGIIIFNTDKIIIKSKEEIQFSISEFSEFKINYGGAEGTMYSNPKILGLKDGTTNSIKFIINDKEFRYRFKVKLKQVYNFKVLIGNWNSKFPNFYFNGELESF
jgi:hypothetical protein